MKLHLIAVGKLKAGPARDGCDDYVRRSRRLLPLQTIEVRDAKRGKSGSAAAWKAAEATNLRAAIPTGARIIALDERGKQFGSREFAEFLGKWKDQGIGRVAFLIGGPDGLDPSLRTEADVLWSLSRMTLPHDLARLVACEQIYRAGTILAGLPYHRD